MGDHSLLSCLIDSGYYSSIKHWEVGVISEPCEIFLWNLIRWIMIVILRDRDQVLYNIAGCIIIHISLIWKSLNFSWWARPPQLRFHDIHQCPPYIPCYFSLGERLYLIPREWWLPFCGMY
jgi:hypothetical protein